MDKRIEADLDWRWPARGIIIFCAVLNEVINLLVQGTHFKWADFGLDLIGVEIGVFIMEIGAAIW